VRERLAECWGTAVGAVRRRVGWIGVWLPGNWWVLIALGIIALGIIFSLIVVNQTSGLVDDINKNISDPKDKADLTRNALQYQADNLTKLWTVIAAALVGYVGWLNYQTARQKMKEDKEASDRNYQIAQDNLTETIRKIDADMAATQQKMKEDKETSDRNYQIAQKNLEETTRKIDADREANKEQQITNRFTQAIGQLGAELKDGQRHLEVRLGGIYALEKIAQDAPEKYYWTVMEVLAAYVRVNAKLPEPPASLSAWRVATPTDIQAALTVIGRNRPPDQQRPDDQRPPRLMLRSTDLRGLGFRTYSDETYNEQNPKPRLRWASLRRVDLRTAHLQGSDLQGVDLAHANLSVDRTLLQGTDLTRAILRGTHLEKANLEAAILTGADLRGAYLDGTNLAGAILEGAKLQGARGLTEPQLTSAADWQDAASLPDNLAHLRPHLRKAAPPQPDGSAPPAVEPVAAEPSASVQEASTPAE
jgi:hypothetical protein